MMLPSRCALLCCLFLLTACGPSAEDNAASAAAASRASAALEPPPAAELPAPTVSEPVAAPASADTLPSYPETETETAPAQPETPAEPVAYGADGMHPICEAYFQRARRCFAHAPAEHATLLQQSLEGTRAELLPADADTCRAVSPQFDEMAQTMGCVHDDGTAAH